MKPLQMSIAAMLSALALTAQAAPLYTNGPATEDSLRCAEANGLCGAEWTIFDDFTLGAPSRIESISWTAYLYGGAADLRSVRTWLYSGDPVFGGGKQLFALDAAPRVQASALGGNAYSVTVGQLNIALAPGSYWLGIQHDTLSNYGTVACANSCGGAYSTQWGLVGGSVEYRMDGVMDYAFSLDGTVQAVPEPLGISLTFAGLLALALTRRRPHTL